MLTAKVQSEQTVAKSGKAPHLRAVNSHAPSRRTVHRRVIKLAVAPEIREFDPLSLERRGPGRIALVAAAYLVLALFLHGMVLMGLIRFGESDEPIALRPEKVVVRIKDPIAPQALPESVPLDVPPAPAPKPEPKADQVEKVKQPKTKPERETLPPADPAVSDPVDMSQNPPDAAEPRRKLVGINFESTVIGGKGPSFAVGNSRMGETGSRAGDGRNSALLPKGRTSGSTTTSPNRVAEVIPSTGVTLEKPRRRVEIQPEYPSALKAQGVEGDVMVLVRIDQTGRVVEVKVVKGSGYDEFDEAATKTAKRESFEPARRNGEPIEYTLKYTYRFRVLNG